MNLLEKLSQHVDDIVYHLIHGPHETRSAALMGVSISFGVLMLLSVALRLYSRYFVRRWLGWDDALIVFALFFSISLSVVVLMGNKLYGWDRHIWSLDLANKPNIIRDALIVAFVAKLLFTFASTATRLSLILFYYRLIKDSGIRWYRWVLHAGFAYNVLLFIVYILLGVLLCNPVSDYWNIKITSQCLDEGVVLLVAGALQCLSDLITTLLPVPIIWRLHMPLRQRVGVSVLLCLGVLVTIAGVVRTYFIWKGLVDEWDETWYTYPLWIAATLEIDIAVICACAPALKPIFQKPIEKLSASLTFSRSSKFSSAKRSPDQSRETCSSGPSVTAHNPRRKWYDYKPLGSGRTHSESNGGESFDLEAAHGMYDRPLQRRDECVAGSQQEQHTGVQRCTPSLQILKRQTVEVWERARHPSV